ncbi:MAG: polysaccharide deacetylase family protein [Aggregatilineales bacterium]
MSRTSQLSSILYKAQAQRLLDAYWGADRLTVLSYHRIIDWDTPDFELYRPNVSASPDMFDRQMAYVSKHFNVIDLACLEAFLLNGIPLPKRSLLITFDDGYRDNYTYAYPIMRRYQLTGVIFLIADKMTNPTAPWWDVCGYMFKRTKKTRAALPVVGDSDLSKPKLNETARESFMRAIKKLPESQKQAAMLELSNALDVPEPKLDEPLFVSWDEVRSLVENGIACQSHTVTHPIMTRIDPAEQKRQLAESRAVIEKETGQRVIAFAYPNGTPDDYDVTTRQALHETGYRIAFTLSPGPMRAATANANPLEIRRVFLSYKDTFEVAVFKMLGGSMLFSR